MSYKSRVSEGAGLRDVPPDTQPQVTVESPVPLLEVPAVLSFPPASQSFFAQHPARYRGDSQIPTEYK